MIRQDRNLKGYKIKGLDITISQYADDTSLFLDGSERSLKHCLNALQEFARYSDLNINQGKTKTIWFGCPRPPEETMLPKFNLEWDPQNFSILGVTFTTDLINITNRNINKHMNKIRTEIESWKKKKSYALWKSNTYKSHLLLQNCTYTDCIAKSVRRNSSNTTINIQQVLMERKTKLSRLA